VLGKKREMLCSDDGGVSTRNMHTEDIYFREEFLYSVDFDDACTVKNFLREERVYRIDTHPKRKSFFCNCLTYCTGTEKPQVSPRDFMTYETVPLHLTRK